MSKIDNEGKKKFYLVTTEVNITKDYVVEAESETEAKFEAKCQTSEDFDVSESSVDIWDCILCDEAGNPIREVTGE